MECPGALQRNRNGHHPLGSNSNGRSATEKKKHADDSSGDPDFDDEHMTRIRYVVVDYPPRIPCIKKLPLKA